MSISKRIEDELNRTEPSEFEPERPEYPWPDEEMREDAERSDSN